MDEAEMDLSWSGTCRLWLGWVEPILKILRPRRTLRFAKDAAPAETHTHRTRIFQQGHVPTGTYTSGENSRSYFRICGARKIRICL